MKVRGRSVHIRVGRGFGFGHRNHGTWDSFGFGAGTVMWWRR